MNLHFLQYNERIKYFPKRSDFENWISSVLALKLSRRVNTIDENPATTVTMCELKKLLRGLENTLQDLKKFQNHIFQFYCSGAFWGLKFEVISEDSIIKMEVSINKDLQTPGKVYGFDEDIRTVLSSHEMDQFLIEPKEELSKIINSS